MLTKATMVVTLTKVIKLAMIMTVIKAHISMVVKVTMEAKVTGHEGR
jgi:hypothetical protein